MYSIYKQKILDPRKQQLPPVGCVGDFVIGFR